MREFPSKRAFKIICSRSVEGKIMEPQSVGGLIFFFIHAEVREECSVKIGKETYGKPSPLHFCPCSHPYSCVWAEAFLGFTQRSQMKFYSTIRLRVASAALKKSVLAYRAQWHEFLVGQGFNRPGDEGCLPDLPGYVFS